MFHFRAWSLAIGMACLVGLAVLGAGCATSGPRTDMVESGDVDLGPADSADYGSRLDARDRKRIFDILEQNPDGELTAWTNQYSQMFYRLTPLNTMEFSNSPPCREFTLELWRSDTKMMGSGVACRQPGGYWKIKDYVEKR